MTTDGYYSVGESLSQESSREHEDWKSSSGSGSGSGSGSVSSPSSSPSCQIVFHTPESIKTFDLNSSDSVAKNIFRKMMVENEKSPSPIQKITRRKCKQQSSHSTRNGAVEGNPNSSSRSRRSRRWSRQASAAAAAAAAAAAQSQKRIVRNGRSRRCNSCQTSSSPVTGSSSKTLFHSTPIKSKVPMLRSLDLGK